MANSNRRIINESSAQTPKGAVVKTENKAKVATTFFAWWRTDIPKDLSYKYWRDIHGVWAARTPGFYQYRQLHLDNVEASLLADLAGIETDLPTQDQPNGIAHIFYSSAFHVKLLRLPFAVKQAEMDEAYFVSRNAFQKSVLPLSRTYVDKINNPDTNGPLKQPRYILAFKKNKGVSKEDFSHFIVKNLAEPWSKQEQVQRLRLEIMEPYTEIPSSPNGTDHSWDKDKQYQAWIELVLSENENFSRLFDQVADLQKYVSAIHAYPVREIYTLVYNGKPTLVGLRGYPAAEIIQEVGAEFQASKQVLKFTYGSAVNGGKLLSQSFYVGLISAAIIGTLLFML